MASWMPELGTVREEQGRALRIALVCAVPLLLGFAAQQYFVFGSALGAAVLVSAAVLLLLGPALLRSRGIRNAANFFVVVTYLALTLVSWARGGATEPVLEWFILIPLIATVFGRLVDAVVWTVICALTYVALVMVDAAGLAPPDTQPSRGDVMAGRLTILLAVGVVCFLLDRLRRARTQAKVVLERQVVENRKLESLGRLAGGIAHDFNNLLSVIVTRTELALDPEADADASREDLRAVRDAARQGTALARELVAFGQRDPASRELVDPGRLLTTLRRVVGKSLRSDVELEVRSTDAARPISADRDQLLQVLLNLCINAQEAMVGGGRIELSARTDVFDEPKVVRTGTMPAGEYTTISIRDTGIGMDEATQNRMFEPFFTTKPRDRGTGLGLSTAHAIIAQHEGYIDVSSRLGRGTQIRIHLPVAQGRARESVATREEVPPELARRHVLLVEDDDGVRAALQLLLSRAGHGVTIASSGEEALELLEAGTTKPDVVLTDVLMPGISGRELASRISERFGPLPIIYMSGHVDNAMADVDLEAEGAHFLRKPVSRHELLETIEQAARQVTKA